MNYPRLLYIGGAGRSGSTILSMLIGCLDDVFVVGEVTHIWRRSYIEDQLCSCGERFSRCELWQRITSSAFGTISAAEIDQLASARDYLFFPLRRHMLIFPPLQTKKFARALRFYQTYMEKLFLGIQEVSGCSLIIDTTKYPAEALFYRSMEEPELFILHLVRKCEAVVHAWTKKKVRVEIHWQKREMPRYWGFVSATGWFVFNLFFECLGRRHTNYLRLFYEEFVKDPQTTLDQLSEFLSLPKKKLPGLSANEFQFPQDHSVSGNPCRFARDHILIQLDDQWNRSINWTCALVAKPFSAAFAWMFGYYR